MTCTCCHLFNTCNTNKYSSCFTKSYFHIGHYTKLKTIFATSMSAIAWYCCTLQNYLASDSQSVTKLSFSCAEFSKYFCYWTSLNSSYNEMMAQHLHRTLMDLSCTFSHENIFLTRIPLNNPLYNTHLI